MTLKCLSGLNPIKKHSGVKKKNENEKETIKTTWTSDKKLTLERTEMPRSWTPYSAEKSLPQPQGMNENTVE